MDKMTMKEIVLRKEGFKDLTLRKVSLLDGPVYYELLSYIYNRGDKRWAKLTMSNPLIEQHIEKYKYKESEIG